MPACAGAGKDKASVVRSSNTPALPHLIPVLWGKKICWRKGLHLSHDFPSAVQGTPRVLRVPGAEVRPLGWSRGASAQQRNRLTRVPGLFAGSQEFSDRRGHTFSEPLAETVITPQISRVEPQNLCLGRRTGSNTCRVQDRLIMWLGVGKSLTR